LEQWPFLKPWYKRFAGEVIGMKQGWILFSILALAVSTITWRITYSVMKSQIHTSNESKMVKKSDYEQIYSTYYTDEASMFKYTTIAYDSGDYAYTIKFFDRAKDLHTSRSYITLTPLYAAAKYAQTPTPEGRYNFEKILNDLVDDINKNSDQDLVGYVLTGLNKIKGQVPSEENDFINKTCDNLIKLRSPTSK
jgi:hypothetical protein